MNVPACSARRKRIPRNSLKRVQHSSGSTDDKKLTAEEVAGREIRRLRTARGWSQEELAERMKAYGYDWHQTLIGRIEAAQRPLRLNEAVDMCRLFRVPLDRLMWPDPDLTPEEVRAQLGRAEQEFQRSMVAAIEARAAAAEADHVAEEAAQARAAARERLRTAEAVQASCAGRLEALRTQLDAGRRPE